MSDQKLELKKAYQIERFPFGELKAHRSSLYVAVWDAAPEDISEYESDVRAAAFENKHDAERACMDSGGPLFVVLAHHMVLFRARERVSYWQAY